MTNEKRYEAVVNMIRAFDAETENTMGEEIIKNPNKYENWQNAVRGVNVTTFYGCAASLLVDAMQGMDKKHTGATVNAAIQRVYKSAQKQGRESFRGAFKSGDRWAICDGYRFIRLNEKPNSVPECSADIDLDGRVIPVDARTAEEVTLPTVAEIKAHIADCKAKYGSKWARRRESAIEAVPGWWCNPNYLLDMVQALPNGVAHLPSKPIAPMYYESEDGDAVLLPVRPVA